MTLCTRLIKCSAPVHNSFAILWRHKSFKKLKLHLQCLSAALCRCFVFVWLWCSERATMQLSFAGVSAKSLLLAGNENLRALILIIVGGWLNSQRNLHREVSEILCKGHEISVLRILAVCQLLLPEVVTILPSTVQNTLKFHCCSLKSMSICN
jgi:hypothetical protein